MEHMNDVEAIGKAIRAERAIKGMSRDALAEKAGCTSRALANYELGKREIGSVQLLAVADALGLSLVRMAGTIENMRERTRDEH